MKNSLPLIMRYENNPILKATDMPYSSSLVFNAGVVKYNGRYVMVFRNDYGYDSHTGRFAGTNLGLAYSTDGLTWEIQPKPCIDIEKARSLLISFYKRRASDEIVRIYDPRITIIEGRCYICFAVDTKHGVRGGIAATEDFENFEVISLSVPDNRNMVLFSEKIGGKFVRLERPFPLYSRGEHFDVWLSDSADLKYWGNSDLLLGWDEVPFSNLKIGPGAPPVKTAKGWLTTFHATDLDESRGKNGWEERWQKRYTIGIMLLELNNPYKIKGISPKPLIVPETSYEQKEGFRTNVLFPGGMILEDNGEVKIYYGAADTVECVATANVDDLIKLCEPLALLKTFKHTT